MFVGCVAENHRLTGRFAVVRVRQRLVAVRVPSEALWSCQGDSRSSRAVMTTMRTCIHHDSGRSIYPATRRDYTTHNESGIRAVLMLLTASSLRLPAAKEGCSLHDSDANPVEATRDAKCWLTRRQTSLLSCCCRMDQLIATETVHEKELPTRAWSQPAK